MAILVNDIGARLCEAIGLDPDSIKRITFDWQAGDIATITYEQYVLDKTASIVKVLESVTWKEVDDGSQGE